jgi:hypothetical protein
VTHRVTGLRQSDPTPLRGITQRWRLAFAVFGKARFARAIAVTPATHAQFDSSRPLAFMHVPKTAGTSLAAALIDTLRPRAPIGGFDRVLFGDYEDFPSLHEEIRRVVYLSPDAMPAEADLVAGHIAYSSLRQRYPDAQLITVLREPFSRVLSHWLYWRGLSDETLAPWGSWADRVRQSHLSLAEFLSSRLLACHLDNLVVRMLLWPHRLIPIDDFIDPEHDRRLLAEAHGRLGGFSFVDVVENPELPGQLQRWLARPLASDRRNETGRVPEPLSRPLVAELTLEALDLLALRSRLDLELWRAVARRCLRGRDPDHLREQTLVRNAAHYAMLMGA